MPQADAFPSTSRRAVLSQLAVLPLVGSLGALMPDARASGGADAMLLARITQAIETHRVMNDRAHEFTDDECLALSDTFDDQLDALADMQAVTPEGLSAKRALSGFICPRIFTRSRSISAVRKSVSCPVSSKTPPFSHKGTPHERDAYPPQL